MNVEVSESDAHMGLFKLVDTCNQCIRHFRFQAETAADAELRQLTDGVCQLLEQFSFELEIENRRLSGESTGIDKLAPGADVLNLRSDVVLRNVLQEYEQVLLTPLTAHARAMVKRQLVEIGRACEQLAEFHRAA